MTEILAEILDFCLETLLSRVKHKKKGRRK